MDEFRKHILAKVFTLLTGVIFLNASFFLAEVSLLRITDNDLIENIAKLISNSGLEEERDSEASEDSLAKEGDLLIHHINLLNQRSSFLIATKANHVLVDHYPHANFAQTFSPPPDTNIFS